MGADLRSGADIAFDAGPDVFWVQRGACMIGRLPCWASRPEHPQPPFLVWWTPNVRPAFRRLWIDEGFNAVYS